MKFIVEGRWFSNRLHAVTFASMQAEIMDRSVDVNTEVRDRAGVSRRSWACTMHPPCTRRTLLTSEERPFEEIPHEHCVL
jgi:hypothetical protein